MSQPKERIDLEKLAMLAVHLSEIRQSIEKTVCDCEALKMDSVIIEGWPTLARGVQFVLDQAQKFVGQASRIHEIDATDLLMPPENS